MKIKIICILFILAISNWVNPQKLNAQSASVNFQIFYDDLSPYGTWVDNSDYGYVWHPNVGSGFSPYSTNGYWILTEDGWTWVSNYSWGWAPFHYGRWFNDVNYGAMWIPDNEWGPGWVDWRSSGNCYGWAPLGPSNRGYNIQNSQWRFAPSRDLGRRDIHNYIFNSSRNASYIHSSKLISNNRIDRARNVSYNAGPDRAEVEKRSGRKISPIAIKETNQHRNNLSKNQYQVYRPQVQKNNLFGSKPAPAKIGNAKNIHTAVQTTNKSMSHQAQQQHTVRNVHQQPVQSHQSNQVVRQQAVQHQNNNQQIQQQSRAVQHNNQPARQQPAQQQHNHPQQSRQGGGSSNNHGGNEHH